MRIWEEGEPLPEDASTQAIAILGRRGSGKTYCAGVWGEQLLEEKVQTIVLDPIGVWWGLRLLADGKTKGFDVVVFGGGHGDLELSETSGTLIADALVDSGASAIVDVSMMTKSAQKRFAADFAERFLFRKKSSRSRSHIIIEECQEFIPQNAKGSERMVGAFQSMVKLGRNFGIGVTMVSQRPQAVSKDALNQSEVLIALQMTGPHERKAIADWVKEKDDGRSRELLGALPSLKVGEAVVWSPGWLGLYCRTKICRKKTFDASATPTSSASPDVKLKPLNLDALKKAMEGAAEKTTGKKPAPHQAVNGVDVEHALARARAAEDLAARRQLVIDDFTRSMQRTRRALENARDAFDAIAKTLNSEALPVVPHIVEGPKVFVKSEVKASRATGGGKHPSLAAAPLAMLQALAQWHPTRLTPAQLSTQSGYSLRSSSFRGGMSALRTANCLDESQRPLIGISAEGKTTIARWPVPATPRTPRDVIQAWREKIHEKAARALFDVLVDQYPDPISRPALADLSGYAVTSSSFRGAMSRLRTNDLIEDNSQGLVRAASSLWMERAS